VVVLAGAEVVEVGTGAEVEVEAGVVTPGLETDVSPGVGVSKSADDVAF
jgi:hypothetical protein